ncbi:MAG: TlpA family protein disulfide reductase [Candidatus Riflebacteria bacterium]|nr:TlpA family protein disulfide reductase [Candidatus Riflebacteria bacterium]
MNRFSLLLLAGLCLAGSALSAQTGPAPAFTLAAIDGTPISLESYKGKIVILDFWAILCPPCRAEIPGFIAIHDKYKEKGVVIIGLSLDKELGKLKTFVAENKITYPIAMANKEVQNAYGNVQAIPTTFILDRNHVIVKKHVGFTTQAVFESDLDEILKAQPPIADPASGTPPSDASSSAAPATNASPAAEPAPAAPVTTTPAAEPPAAEPSIAPATPDSPADQPAASPTSQP